MKDNTASNKRKVLNIREDVYNPLREYCETKGYVMYKLVEKILREFLEKENKDENKKDL